MGTTTNEAANPRPRLPGANPSYIVGVRTSDGGYQPININRPAASAPAGLKQHVTAGSCSAWATQPPDGNGAAGDPTVDPQWCGLSAQPWANNWDFNGPSFLVLMEQKPSPPISPAWKIDANGNLTCTI